jgi:hypothetical protein
VRPAIEIVFDFDIEAPEAILSLVHWRLVVVHIKLHGSLLHCPLRFYRGISVLLNQLIICHFRLHFIVSDFVSA